MLAWLVPIGSMKLDYRHKTSIRCNFRKAQNKNAQKCKDGNFKNLPKRKSLGTTFFFFSGEKEFLFFKKEKSLKTILFWENDFHGLVENHIFYPI